MECLQTPECAGTLNTPDRDTVYGKVYTCDKMWGRKECPNVSEMFRFVVRRLTMFWTAPGSLDQQLCLQLETPNLLSASCLMQ